MTRKLPKGVKVLACDTVRVFMPRDFLDDVSSGPLPEGLVIDDPHFPDPVDPSARKKVLDWWGQYQPKE